MKTLRPSVINGSVTAPPSKSAAQRAIAIAALCEGESVLYNIGTSEDVQAAIRVCESLGADINHMRQPGDGLRMAGGIKSSDKMLNCGESGLCLRMFSGIAAALPFPVQLTGEGSLLNRPISMITTGMSALGVECLSADGGLPVTIKGPIEKDEVTLDASGTSQLLTGVLIAAPLLNQDLPLRVRNLASKPYIDLTIDIMNKFGVRVDHDDYRVFYIRAGQRYSPIDYRVEGDWSGAAFFLVAGAIAGNVIMKGLQKDSFQADRMILNALKQAGASLHCQNDGIIIADKRPLRSFEFDATDCPDLFPPLAVLAANCEGESKIIGTERLHSKESDRAATLVDLLTKLGIRIRVHDNTMYIKGGQIKSAKVHSHGDHRIAMAAAIAALNADGPVHITGADAVNKSYPGFFGDLEALM